MSAGRLLAFVDALAESLRNGEEVTIAARSRQEADRIVRLLHERHPDCVDTYMRKLTPPTSSEAP